MRPIHLMTVLIAGASLSGCASSTSDVRDYDLYDTGEPRRQAVFYSEGPFENLSEYFPDGRLKSEQWLRNSAPLVKLTFYENARLKSEERFFNTHLIYAVHYAEDGAVQRELGRRINSESNKLR